jgi:hypothetical protein
MSNHKKALTTDQSNKGKTSKQQKQLTILQHLINGNTLNRFEAERIGDHCLNSTVSYFCNSKGLSISRKRENVPNRFGGKTSVCKYWLSQEQRIQAIKLIGGK